MEGGESNKDVKGTEGEEVKEELPEGYKQFMKDFKNADGSCIFKLDKFEYHPASSSSEHTKLYKAMFHLDHIPGFKTEGLHPIKESTLNFTLIFEYFDP